MFSVKHKIIFSNLAVVILASALIAFPVIQMQMATIKDNVTDNANAQVSQACSKINSFLLKPQTIVNDMAVFVTSHEIEQKEAEIASGNTDLTQRIKVTTKDEIRKLSETSSAQSKKITGELSKIQSTIATVVESSKVSSNSFNIVNEQIMNTDQLVRQIRAAMEEQQVGSQQIVDSLKVMNDGTLAMKLICSNRR